MGEPQNELDARMPPRDRDETGVTSATEDPGEIRQEIAQTRAELSETIDAIGQEPQPQQPRREATTLLRDEATERVDRLIGEVTLRASRAGAMAAGVAQQVSREAKTRVDAVRVRVTGDIPMETGQRTRQEVRTAARRLRQWAREEPAQFAAALAVVLAAVVIVGRQPRDARQARVQALQRRARR